MTPLFVFIVDDAARLRIASDGFVAHLGALKKERDPQANSFKRGVVLHCTTRSSVQFWVRRGGGGVRQYGVESGGRERDGADAVRYRIARRG